eukprot:gene11099-12932_t
MSHKIEQRKNAFKAKNIPHSGDRIRKQTEQLRKDKRSANVLAKRLKTDTSVDAAESSASANYTKEYVTEAIAKINGVDIFSRLDGLVQLRTVLCSTSDFTDFIIESGLPLFLSSLLASPNEDIRIEAAWCLTNIANGDHKQTGSVLCAVPYMIEILSSSATGAVAALRRDSAELLEQICWVIGNIAGDCDEYRTILVSNGCLPAVLTFLESSVADIVRNKDAVPRFGAPVNDRPSTAAQTAAWALSKVPYLLDLMSSHTHGAGLAEEIWWLFTFLTAKEDEVVSVLLELGIVQRIAEALVVCNGDSVTSIPLIRSVGNLSSGPQDWIDLLLAEPRLLDALQFLCSYTGAAQWADPTAGARKAVAKESLWVVGNILGGSATQRLALLSHRRTDVTPCPLLDSLLQCIHSDEFDLQQEAIFALEQACLETYLLRQFVCPQSPASGLNAVLVPLAGQLERLLRVPSSDVPLCVVRIISALTQAHSTHCDETGNTSAKYDLVHVWVDAGITEALDDIQYSDGSSSGGGDRNSLGEVAAALVEQLYALLEQEENEDHSSLPHTANGADTSSRPAGGIPSVGSHHSLAPSPFASSAAQQNTYTFGATAPSPTVFSFDSAVNVAPPNTMHSIGGVQGFGSVGGGNSANNLTALGGASSPSPFNNNHLSQPSNSNSGHCSPVPPGSGGRGRGSHINKPSWMN